MAAIALIVISIAIIIALSSYLKVHPFLSLIIAAIFFRLVSGMPAGDVINALNEGFGSTIGKVGIIIVAGIIIGTFLENTGGAQTLANKVLAISGKKKVHTAMAFVGYMVSVPVFADSGFIILSSLNKMLTKKAGLSLAGTAAALALGLTATHTMVPPTPGPVAAAGILGADIGLVIFTGVATSIFALIIVIFYARYIGKKIYIDPAQQMDEPQLHIVDEYRPSAFKSFLPIVVPILLIVLKTVAEFSALPFGNGWIQGIIIFTGNPVMALLIGVVLALFLPKKLDKEMLSASGWTGKAIKNAAAVIIITGAGGAFGNVLQNAGLATLFSGMNEFYTGIWLPFLIAAAIKTAQGSSTVALITAASLTAPMLDSIAPDEFSKAIVVVAIGAGSAVVSHANDSFFWIVTQFSHMDIKQGYRVHTLGTAIMGISSMLFLTLIHFLYITL